MDKHTKTPWRESYVSDGRLTSVVGPDGAYVADRVKIPDASLIVTAVNEREALLKAEEALREMVEAASNGHIDSEELPGDPDSGIMPYKWHEEWAHYARSALSHLEEVRSHGK